MINKNDLIDVYNEHAGNIYGVSSANNIGYKFEMANEDGEPSITQVLFNDVLLMNNKSEIFKNGTLRFDPELEDEIYKELRIDTKHNKNFYTKEDIEDTILNPTTDKLNKILEVTSVITIEKIRAILVKLDNEGEYDIPMRVFDVVNARAYELSKGKIKSAIKLVKKKNEKTNIELGVIDEIKTEEQPKKTTRGRKITE